MLFKRQSKPGAKAGRPPAGSPGKRLYAIGDVHGRHDLLLDLLQVIERHDDGRDKAESHVIFLGDLIDRGPASRAVIEHLRASPPSTRHHHFIKGNHEESLVRGLSGEPNLLAPWLHHGGYETAESYGVDRSYLIGQPDHVLEHTLMSAIPSSHVRFLSGFHDSIRFGDYLFVHAGVRPGLPLAQQSGKDLRWIRHEFLESEADFGHIVVHGHTVTEEIVERPNRIGLDTGAYRTGRLSAIWIEGTERGFLQANGAPTSYDEAAGKN